MTSDRLPSRVYRKTPVSLVYITGYCPIHRTHEIYCVVSSQPSALPFAMEAQDDKGWRDVRTDRDPNNSSRGLPMGQCIEQSKAVGK